MEKIIFKLSNERLTTPTGLPTVGYLLGDSKFIKRCNKVPVNQNRCEPYIKDGTVILSYIGQLCQGKPCFEAAAEMKDDPEFYNLAYGVKGVLPSPETLRQRFDKIGSSKHTDILEANVEMFCSHNIEPSALENGYVPVDIDVTPMDNSKTTKEGVSRTYKGFDGYAPMMAYIGTEGYLLNEELRKGKQHCQCHTPEFLKESLYYAHKLTDEQLLIRLDSGNDAAENYGILIEDGDWFVVKRNPRKESRQQWLDEMKKCCKNIRHPRDGKTVYVGSTWKPVSYVTEKNEKKTIEMRIVYEITERTTDRNGQILLVPDIELNTWWTNLGWTDEEIIESYHTHGECEQYHSEIKTDMDVERLPSRKFETNKLVLDLTLLAYNILRIVGKFSLLSDNAPKLRHPIKRRRIRTVIANLILIAGHLTVHAGKFIISLGKSNIWRRCFLDVINALV